MNHIILNLLILHITLLYYIILHLALILLIIYIYVKTEMVKLNWRGLDCGNQTILGERLMVEVAGPSKVCFPHIYIFFKVMLMSMIDEIRSCLEDCMLLFLFDLCMYVYDQNPSIILFRQVTILKSTIKILGNTFKQIYF